MSCLAASNVASGTVRPADTVELRFGIDHSVLTAAYCMWRAYNQDKLIFFKYPNITLGAFLDWSLPTNGKVEAIGFYVGNKMIGVGWIFNAYRLGGKKVAEVAAAFFKKTPLSIWRSALDLSLNYVFEDRKFDEVYGQSACQNRGGALLSKFCGMTMVHGKLPWGEDPGANTVVYKLDRHTWESHRRPEHPA